MSERDPLDISNILAAGEARRKRLLDHLERCDIQEILGVVHASGPSGSSGGGGAAAKWTFSLTLEPWRRADGQLERSELYLRKPVSEEEVGPMIRSIPAYSVLRIRARVSKNYVDEVDNRTANRSEGLLVELIDPACNDAELNQIAKDLQVPRIYRDDYFGKLKLDRSLNWLVSTRRRLFSKYEICIERQGETYDAKAAWDRLVFIESRMQQVREAIVEHLFGIYSTTWKSLGKLSPAQFVKKIKLSSIVLETGGSTQIWFHDGGLFLGHDIEVRVDKDGAITWANLAG